MARATIVAEHYARGGPTTPWRPFWLDSKARSDCRRCGDSRIGQGLACAEAPILTSEVEGDMERLASRLPPEHRGLLVKLATSWGSKRFEKLAAETSSALAGQVRDEKLNYDRALAARAEFIGNQTGDPRVQAALELITPRSMPEFTMEFVRHSDQRGARGRSTPDRKAVQLHTRLPGRRHEHTLGAGPTGPELARSSQCRQRQLSDLTLDQKQLLIDHPDRNLGRWARQLLSRSGGGPPIRIVRKFWMSWHPSPRCKGRGGRQAGFQEPVRGCHVHSGEGTRMAPT